MANNCVSWLFLFYSLLKGVFQTVISTQRLHWLVNTYSYCVTYSLCASDIFAVFVLTASSNSSTRCYCSCISITLTNSGSDNNTKPQVWNTSYFLKFSTNSFPDHSCAPRAKVKFASWFILMYLIIYTWE